MGNMLAVLRYVSMEKPTLSHSPPSERNGVSRTVQAPQRHEGIGNALRAAFNPGSYGMPDDMARLLRQMD